MSPVKTIFAVAVLPAANTSDRAIPDLNKVCISDSKKFLVESVGDPPTSVPINLSVKTGVLVLYELIFPLVILFV